MVVVAAAVVVVLVAVIVIVIQNKKTSLHTEWLLACVHSHTYMYFKLFE